MADITPLPQLEGHDRDQVRMLVARCRLEEGLYLKVNMQPFPHFGGAWGAFVARDGERIVGYVALFPSEPAEFCGLVDPAYRRRGIGTALLNAAREEVRLRETTGQLISEASSPGAQAFLHHFSFPLDYQEDLMELETVVDPLETVPHLVVRRATTDDVPQIAQILAAAFDDPIEQVRGFVANGIAHPGQETYLAAHAGQPVATLKAIDLGEGIVGIYAFAVAPDRQGQGIGRTVLTHLLRQLQSVGWRHIRLEVDVTNTPAIQLYRSSGFRALTTYGYYRVEPV